MISKKWRLLAVIVPVALWGLPNIALADIPENVDFHAEQTTAGMGNWVILKNILEYDDPHWQDIVPRTELYVDNLLVPDLYKDVWFEAEYSGQVPDPLPELLIFDPAQGVTPFEPVVDGTHVTWHWLIYPQPGHEIIRFPDQSFYDLEGLDKIEVGTYCFIPEPATVSLLALGGLAMAKRRR